MTEPELKEEMQKAINEVFKTDEIIYFMFDLTQKAFTKGLELGMKVNKKEN